MTTFVVIATAVVAMAFVAGNKKGNNNHFMGSSTSMMFGNQMA